MKSEPKYFDFDMLEKHTHEFYDKVHDWIWFVIIMVIVYTAYKLFEKYDR